MMRPAAALLLLICPLLSTASFCDATGDWKLDWLEEFDSLDLDAWSVVQGNDEGSCRDALCTASNVKVSGGHLVITSKRENEGGYNFTTGAVQTAGKKHWAYKPKFRLCVSAMLPGGGGNGKGQGIWPAIWMMPDAQACDPDLGEMDIMEMVDGDGTVYGTYHWQTDYPAEKCKYPKNHLEVYATGEPKAWDTTFHEYAVEHGETYVAYVYDGVTVLNASTSKPPPTPIFHSNPFYLILNTAVGGGWPGQPDNTTLFPTYYTIDYVRVAVEGS